MAIVKLPEANMAIVNEDRVVVALDFGTTFSGIAYSFNNPGKKAEINPITDWPGLEGRSEPKVPTLIAYDVGNPQKFRWGGQVTWGTEAVHGVKLLLDPSQERPAYLPSDNLQHDIRHLPKRPVDIVADFLKAIYGHAISKIKDSAVGDYFEYCHKDYVLSVPAVWSDKAKDLTIQAAKKAGIYPVTLVKEPEAAALYTMINQEQSMRVGSTFMICDAGGGTVDLITYQVSKIDPLELIEIVPGSGGMVGSLGLNEMFTKMVSSLVGEDQWSKLKGCIGWTKAANDFETNIKRAFRGRLGEEYFVSFPRAKLQDDPLNNLEGDAWRMTGIELRRIFRPLLNDIQALVSQQIKDAMQKTENTTLEGIFLVGGFGESPYLKDYLAEMNPGIQIIQPTNAWSAIVKGAVLSRLPKQASVVATQAVHHYGVVALSIMDPVIDAFRPIVADDFDGKSRVEKCTWYINKGQELWRDQPIKLPFYRTFEIQYGPSDLILTNSLYYSQLDSAPIYPGRMVKKVCTLKSDLTNIPRHLFRRVKGIRGDYYEIHFSLTLSTAAANMKFALEVGGVEMGSVEASYV